MLEDDAPDSIRPVEFVEPADGQTVNAYGYPRGSRFGNYHDGQIKGELENGWFQIDDDKEIGIFLQAGFSGTPLWDKARRAATGIAVAAERAPDKQGVGYLMPASLLQRNDSDWKWAWRFAIEMAHAVWQPRPDTLVASLATLFDRPAAGTRPCELMYRAWSVLDDLPQGRAVLEKFCADFGQLFHDRHAIALQLVSEEELVEMGILSREEADRTPLEERNFVRCPPEELGIDGKAFWMGTVDGDVGYDDERPRHQTVVSPFRLQSTPVTRAQYRLFDPEHEKAHTEVFEKGASDDACPVIMVNWYDAWVFSRWIGGRLPTDAEWEYACRAGRDGERDYFHFGDSLASHQANFDGDYPFPSDGEEGPYEVRTTPVRKYEGNTWGLYDMHGKTRVAKITYICLAA